MTKEELNKKWDLIVAFKEGKIIQYKRNTNNTHDWVDTYNLSFYADLSKYRIKPENPKEYWIIIDKDKGSPTGAIFSSEENANQYLIDSMLSKARYKIIHTREVIE